MIRLEDWSILLDEDPYCPPEALARRLHGKVYGDPRGRLDGTSITTSRILKVSGRMIITRSGTKYELGEVSDSYRKWMKDMGYPFDPDNPIRVVDRYTQGPLN